MLASAPAVGSECGPLRPTAAFSFVPDAMGRPLVPATLNGRKKHLLIDTGGFNSTIEKGVARELGLRPTSVNVGVTTITGASSSEVVRVGEVLLGPLRLREHYFWLDPESEASRDVEEHEMAGLIGTEVLRTYDLELDAHAGTLNFFSQEHCPGQIPQWPSEKVVVVPFRLGESFHVTFPVTLDGKVLNAILDTGAADTVMNLSVALRDFAVDINAPNVQRVDQIRAASGEPGSRPRAAEAVYRRRFDSLTMGELTVDDPMITLLPDLMGHSGGLPDLIIGMSTLMKLHVYVAYRERKLYISTHSAGRTNTVPPAPN
jgi:predicted aspartyl protease